MGDSTSIEWTDATWNPVRGCSRVSKGCEHCYAEGVARRFSGPGQPYEGLVRLDRDGKAKAQWNGTVRMVPEHLADPLRWSRPRRVFVNSMSDLFHEALAFEDIAAIFGVMAACPRHTFQVLTKRPKRAREFFAWIDAAPAWGNPRRTGEPIAVLCDALGEIGAPFPAWIDEEGEALFERVKDADWPLPNVWLGVSVEDQATADERIPHLLACPASVRFVSYEPALGPVDFTTFLGGANAQACGDQRGGGRDFGRTVDRQRWPRVEARGAESESLGGRNALDSVRATKSGEVDASRVPHGSGDGGRDTALRTRAPAGLACDARPDPRGPHDQSQERGPRGQPTGEPRARDLLRADEGRDSTGLRPDSEPSISWLIVGGESGPGARPFDLAWARSVVTQCREAGVPAFFKQAGAQPVDAPRDAGGFVVTQPGGDPWPSRPVRLRHRKGADLSELPAELRVREFPNPKDTTR